MFLISCNEKKKSTRDFSSGHRKPAALSRTHPRRPRVKRIRLQQRLLLGQLHVPITISALWSGGIADRLCAGKRRRGAARSGDYCVVLGGGFRGVEESGVNHEVTPDQKHSGDLEAEQEDRHLMEKSNQNPPAGRRRQVWGGEKPRVGGAWSGDGVSEKNIRCCITCAAGNGIVLGSLKHVPRKGYVPGEGLGGHFTSFHAQSEEICLFADRSISCFFIIPPWDIVHASPKIPR